VFADAGSAGRPRIRLSDWAATGGRFEYRGHSIFVRDEGAGEEALLLIHGFPTASWDWEAIWPDLAQRFHAYTLDMIGFGFSAKPRDYAYSIVDQATLCESFLSHAGVNSYHVLAHDYGDSVAQELLARQGEAGRRPKLLSVAFLNGGLFPETHRPVFIQRLLLSPLGALVAKLTNRSMMARSMRRIFGPATPPDDALIEGFWKLMTANGGQAVFHKLISYLVERRECRARWVGALQNAPIPLKFINGAADPISGAHMVARYRELVPSPDVTVLDGVGHYPQVEAASAVLAAYLEFRGCRRLDSASQNSRGLPAPLW